MPDAGPAGAPAALRNRGPIVFALGIACIVGTAAILQTSSNVGVVRISGASWSQTWGINQTASPAPLWWPYGDCLNFTGAVPVGGNFSCWFGWGGYHCVPNNATPASCSIIVAFLVSPPFRLVAATPLVGYGCHQVGCANYDLTILAPDTAGVQALRGTLVYQSIVLP